MSQHILAAQLIYGDVHAGAAETRLPHRLSEPPGLPKPCSPAGSLPFSYINGGDLIPADGIILPIAFEDLFELLMDLFVDLIAARKIHIQQRGIPIPLQIPHQCLQPLRSQVIELHLDEFEGFREGYRCAQDLHGLVLELIVRNIQIFQTGEHRQEAPQLLHALVGGTQVVVLQDEVAQVRVLRQGFEDELEALGADVIAL